MDVSVDIIALLLVNNFIITKLYKICNFKLCSLSEEFNIKRSKVNKFYLM